MRTPCRLFWNMRPNILWWSHHFYSSFSSVASKLQTKTKSALKHIRAYMAEVALGIVPLVFLGLPLSATIGNSVSDLTNVPTEALFVPRELTSFCGILNRVHDMTHPSSPSVQPLFISSEITTELQLVLEQTKEPFTLLESPVGKLLERRERRMSAMARIS